MPQPFQVVEHTADLQLHITGKTIAELFAHALIGMFTHMKPQAPGCVYEDEFVHCDQLSQKREIAIQSYDIDSLLIDFLAEALYLSAVHHEAYLAVDIKQMNEKTITATLAGVQVTGFDCDIKAVTYHDAHIVQDNGIWAVDVVFDL